VTDCRHVSVSKECNETGNERAEFDGPQIVHKPAFKLIQCYSNKVELQLFPHYWLVNTALKLNCCCHFIKGGTEYFLFSRHYSCAVINTKGFVQIS